jgi:uncharacterized protein YndB with AHSA1/START domain
VEINQTAPVAASAEIQVTADPHAVWRVLTGIDQWPSWNPDVKSASLEGELAAGSRFKWKAGPGTIVSTIQQVDPPRSIAWTGKTLGLRAIHVYRLKPRDDGTLVSSQESWEGLAALAFRRRMQRTLERAMEAGLLHLKAEAERRPTDR